MDGKPVMAAQGITSTQQKIQSAESASRRTRTSGGRGARRGSSKYAYEFKDLRADGKVKKMVKILKIIIESSAPLEADPDEKVTFSPQDPAARRSDQVAAEILEQGHASCLAHKSLEDYTKEFKQVFKRSNKAIQNSGLGEARSEMQSSTLLTTPKSFHKSHKKRKDSSRKHSLHAQNI